MARISSPMHIDCPKNIFLGKVIIGYKSWLAANQLTNTKECELIIRNGCIIGNFNHIYATNSIIIEDNVLTADKVYISDNSHEYRDVSMPIINQPILQLKKVVIGEGSWIGENVCILGASVGKHCVIGANSVVTKDIPDYCVAVGSPAVVVKRYNTINKKWEKYNHSI
jgi:acetyltransferase-like isoleucine patch superfamily enzyme